MGKYQLGDWVVDSSRGLLIDGDETTKVEPKCMDLLVLLINANGDLVTRKAIMESLWQGRYVSEHALNNVVAMLRKYLNKGNGKNYITTQPKRGYILSEPAFKLETTLDEKVKFEQGNAKDKSNGNSVSKKLAFSILAAVLAIAFAVIGITASFLQPAVEEDISIAVMPFEAINSEESSVVFAKGLIEEISHQLSANTRLNVIATSITQSADEDTYSATYILEGSVRTELNRLRITTRLVNRNTGNQLWSEVYTANKKDMISSQYSVSRQLTKTISTSLETVSILNDSDINANPQKITLTPNAAKFFLNHIKQSDPSQSIVNEWQIGMYNGSVFELFDYSPTTILGRSAIVGWVNRGFHAGFLNTSNQDELFPGNVFTAEALSLHPGDNSSEIVLRYLVQLDGDYEISGDFFAIDSIECLKCTSDGVNVSVRVNGSQLNESGDITGFGDTRTYQITGSAIPLQQGDVVDFIVMPRSTFFDDATIVTASVVRKD